MSDDSPQREPVSIPEYDEDLLLECEVEVFRSSGPGGQNVNRRETAVRLRHVPTGVVVQCQRERSQYRNKQLALEMLRRRLERMNRREKPRVATKVPRRVKEKILAAKRRVGERKKLRRRPHGEDD